MSEILTLNNVFLIVAGVSTLLYIIKMALFLLVGGDSEVDTSFDSISDNDVSFNYISLQTILAFLMGFGWSGLAAYNQLHVKPGIAFLIAVVAGFIFLYVTAYLMFSIKKLNKIIKVDLNELVNKTGRTYTSFAAKAEGQIEIDLNGKLSVLDAYNLTDEEIKAFAPIKVEKIENNKIYIVKV